MQRYIAYVMAGNSFKGMFNTPVVPVQICDWPGGTRASRIFAFEQDGCFALSFKILCSKRKEGTTSVVY